MTVTTKRTAILVVVLGALAAWLAAAATSGVRSARPVPAPRSKIDERGAALSAEIERLHERLRPTAAPEHGRNLFQFKAHVPVPAPQAAAAAAAQAAVPPAPAAPVEPPFKLIGIAEDNGSRTAILTSSSQLLMLHEGDVVNGSPAFRVTGISTDAVELTASTDGAVLRLALK